MKEIFFIAAIGIISIEVFFRLFSFMCENAAKRKYSKNFKNNIKSIAERIDKEKELESNRFRSELEEEMQKERDALSALTLQIDLEKENYEEKIKEQEQEYRDKILKRKNFYEETLSDMQQSTQTKLLDLTTEEKDRIEKLKLELKAEKNKAEEEFLTALISLEEKKKEIEKDIAEKEEKQKLVIERFRADEEAREQSKFYSIEIAESGLEDIKKLQTIAKELHNPTALYKLIFETYYRSPMNALFGRVLAENKACGGIYKITKKENQKIYIGKTVNFKTRWTTHIKRGLKIETLSSNRLYSDMWKFGPENFTFQIVETCDKDKQSEREKYWINYYDSQNYGYNDKAGG